MFKPNYLTKDSFGGWYVHEELPFLDSVEWTSNKGIYEIGIDDSKDEVHTAKLCRNVDFTMSCFKINETK